MNPGKRSKKETSQLVENIMKVVGKMSRDTRRVFLMYYSREGLDEDEETLSLEEIGETLHMDYNEARQRYETALAMVRHYHFKDYQQI